MQQTMEGYEDLTMPDSPDRTLVLNLIEALAHSASAEVADAEEVLSEMGIDPNEVRERGVAFVTNLQGKLRLETAGRERRKTTKQVEALRSQLAEQVQTLQTASKMELLQRLNDHYQVRPNFRKIESLDVEDVLEMIKDAEVLQILKDHLEND